ncbi:hypothetical protein BDB00DRAFT_783050 [Zychaea mexicana]|uniref:uncharacterized protein n=1 Tax=Zychaea mexicana TaxID=64656 RepID=UPI0022FE35FD|nr:uncharacterized protein BDB00DRAFT_783050 [Zychaea mexicana]KAI9499559.1 hypothetical protein BDB00DRAFT_783050 [Zychaea mexicana]
MVKIYAKTVVDTQTIKKMESHLTFQEQTSQHCVELYKAAVKKAEAFVIAAESTTDFNPSQSNDTRIVNQLIFADLYVQMSLFLCQNAIAQVPIQKIMMTINDSLFDNFHYETIIIEEKEVTTVWEQWDAFIHSSAQGNEDFSIYCPERNGVIECENGVHRRKQLPEDLYNTVDPL